MHSQVSSEEVGLFTKLESRFLNLDSNFANKEAVRSTILWWRDHLLNEVSAKTLCQKNIDELSEA